MLTEKVRQANLLSARRLHEGAYGKFWDRVQAAAGDRMEFFDYELVNQLFDAPWRTISGGMAGGELREATNLIHRWMLDLDRLGLWIAVLADYGDDNDRWAIRHEFVEPLAHRCLQAPSHFKDVLIQVATNAAHQASLALISGHVDVMRGDPVLKNGKLAKRGFLTRNEALFQLKEVAAPWPQLLEFLQYLELLDTNDYRQRTRNYRNRASHAVPPNFEFGEVQYWTRSVGYGTVRVRKPDGTSRFMEDTNRKTVSYNFGGILPLSLADAMDHCRSEYKVAISAFSTYRTFLKSIFAALNERS